MWTFDEKTRNAIAQSSDNYRIFEIVGTVSRRSKEGFFIYSKNLPIYAGEQVPITIIWRECTPNVIFI